MSSQHFRLTVAESHWHSIRNYTVITKEQRHMEQMDKLRRTLARSERKRRERALVQ